MVNTAAQFDKAVAIVKALPPDGPVKPSQDDQLAVSGRLGCRTDGSSWMCTWSMDLELERNLRRLGWCLCSGQPVRHMKLTLVFISSTGTSSKLMTGIAPVQHQVRCGLSFGSSRLIYICFSSRLYPILASSFTLSPASSQQNW